MRLIRLPLPHSHPLSQHFCFTLPADRSSTRRPVLITPPIVAGCSNPIVLTGHSAIRDWQSKGRRSIPVLTSLPERSPMKTLWKTRWALAAQYRYSDIEIAHAFHRCVLDCLVTPSEVYRWIPELLRTHGPNELLQIGSLPRPFLIRMHMADLDWSTASRLADLCPTDRRRLFVVCCLFSHVSSSQFRMILDSLRELSIIGNNTIRHYLRDPLWQHEAAGRTRKQRAQLLATHLHRLRNPVQSRFQEKTDELISRLSLPPGCKVLTPSGGEGCMIDLNLRIASIDDLNKFNDALRDNRETIVQLLRVLRDE